MKFNTLKPLVGVAAILTLISSLSGCDLFDKVDDINIDIELTHEFVINEEFDSDGDPVPYVSIGVIDATQDSDFNKYKDKIKEIKINSITYTVTDYTVGDAGINFSSGMGSFFATGSTTNAIASAAIGFQNIQSAVGQTFTLDYNTQGLEAIAAELQSVNKIDFHVAGILSETPVAFKVPVTIHCTMVAEVTD
jgi:hypothetical protein